MEDTFNDSLPPYLPNSIPMSLIMTEQSEFKLPSKGTWNSLTFLSSPISESSGSMSQVLPELHSHGLPNTDNSKCLVESPMMCVNSGMIENAQTRWPCATMHMSASTVRVVPTLERSVWSQPKSKLSQQWESRSKYA